MQRLVVAVLPLALGIAVSGCSTSTTGPTDLSGLPTATGAVSSGTAVSLSDVRRGGNLFNATTGVVLADAATSTFSGKSRVMCEMTAAVRNILREAAQPDKIQCYVGAMEAAGVFSNSYDGDYHYYKLAGAGGEDGSGALQIKFKAVKTNGVISNFEMFTCQNSVQSEYISTTLSGTNASIGAVSSHSQTFGSDTFSGANRVSVSGTFSNGAWSGTKTITAQGEFSQSGTFTFSDERYVELTQGPSTLTFKGYGSNSFGGHTGTSSIYAVIQGIGMGDMTTFAVGDGTGKAEFTYDSFSHTGTVSWNGDTKLNLSSASDGDYYSEVNAATLPSATSPDTTFTTAETWNCAPATSFSEINFAAMQSNTSFSTNFQACNTNYGFGEEAQQWIDCPHTGD